MNSDEATVAVIDALHALDIPYILVGSLASNLYGIPRSTKDVEDARGVVAVQGDPLDWNYIRRWCDAHGTRELLDKVRASTYL
jgi:hypothetical protein